MTLLDLERTSFAYSRARWQNSLKCPAIRSLDFSDIIGHDFSRDPFWAFQAGCQRQTPLQLMPPKLGKWCEPSLFNSLRLSIAFFYSIDWNIVYPLSKLTSVCDCRAGRADPPALRSQKWTWPSIGNSAGERSSHLSQNQGSIRVASAQ